MACGMISSDFGPIPFPVGADVDVINSEILIANLFVFKNADRSVMGETTL